MPWTQFKLNWTPAPDSIRQIALWRIKGTTTWNTNGFTSTNPLAGDATTTTLYLHEDADVTKENVIYQFKIESICNPDAPIVIQDNGEYIEMISFLDSFDTDYGISELYISIPSTGIKNNIDLVLVYPNLTPFISKIRIVTRKHSDNSLISDTIYPTAINSTNTQWNASTGTNSFHITGLTPGFAYYLELELFAIINGVEVSSVDPNALRGAILFNQGNVNIGDWHNLLNVTLV